MEVTPLLPLAPAAMAAVAAVWAVVKGTGGKAVVDEYGGWGMCALGTVSNLAAPAQFRVASGRDEL